MPIVQLNLFDCKRCSTCGAVKPLIDYHRNRSSPDGLSYICKPCSRTKARETYLRHHEDRKARNRAIYWSNPEKARADKRAYHGEHPGLYEQRRAYYQQRYQAKKDEIREYQREYAQLNPESGRKRALRHARLKGHKKIHHWPALRAWFGNICLCCGATHRIEADHVIPLSKGGSNHISNIQPLCFRCNAGKRVKTTDYRDPERLAAFLAQLVE